MMEPTHDHTKGVANTDRTLVRDRLRHVSWGAIFAGLIAAIALQILLGFLGVALGLTILDPSDPAGSISGWGIATGIYVIVVQLVSLFIGGYIAAQLSPARTTQTAMLHGVSIWGLATILMVWLGGNMVGTAVGGLTSAISAAGGGAAQAVQAVIPDNINLPEVSYEALPESIQQTLQQNGITPANFQQELRSAYNQVVSPGERRQLMQRLRETVTSILQNPTQAPEEVEQTINEVFGQGGILGEEDLTEMQNALQRQLNLSPQETGQIVNQVQQAIQELRSTVQEGVQKARQQAVDAAEATSSAIASVAWWLFIANLLALIAAVVGGKAGEARRVEY